VQHILSVFLEDEKSIHDWFGRYVTTKKYSQLSDLEVLRTEDSCTIEELRAHLGRGKNLTRNEGSRFAYISRTHKKEFFVDGLHIDTSSSTDKLVDLLCKKNKINYKDFHERKDNFKLLLMLIKRGALYLDK